MFGNVNVDYKPCKTVTQLRRACNYILGRNPEQINSGVVKTRSDLYYAFDDDRDNFADAVLLTRRLWNKPCDKRSNLAYKMSISFHPDEKLSYEEAFQIAREYADNYFHSKGFDVMFAVHTDKDHVHAHFIIGNCNRDTGKAFRRNEKDLYTMSQFFGEQCIKRGLTRSVREDYYSKNPWQIKETFNEAQMRKKGKETFKSELREAIDKECRDIRNKTFEDVMEALWEHYHVETRVKGNTVSYRHPEHKNKAGELVSVRGSKLGDAYTKGGIEFVLKELRTREVSERDRTGISETGEVLQRAGSSGITGNKAKGQGNSSAATNGGNTAGNYSYGAEERDEQYSVPESSESRRSTSGQGSGYSSRNSDEYCHDTGELYREYVRKVRRAEQKAAESAERSKRIRKKRSEQYR